jgi:hypothetical protein
MRPFSEISCYAIDGASSASEGGGFLFRGLLVIASWGGGWDHVSVSRKDRCPTWEEMERVKRAFFRPDEVAMQLHVTPDNHISVHPFCLHIWRPQEVAIPLPPKWMVA